MCYSNNRGEFMEILTTISDFFSNMTTEQIVLNIGIGLVGGFFGKLLNNNKGGTIVCLIIGIVGSFIGPFILEAFKIEGLGSLYRLVAAFVGGFIFAWVAGKFSN